MPSVHWSELDDPERVLGTQRRTRTMPMRESTLEPIRPERANVTAPAVGMDQAQLDGLAARALDHIRDGALVGLGSGRAASAFVRALEVGWHVGSACGACHVGGGGRGRA